MKTTKFLFHFLYFQNFWQAAANPHEGRSRRLASAGIAELAGFNTSPWSYTASGAQCREMNIPQHQGSAGKVKRCPSGIQGGARSSRPLQRSPWTPELQFLWGEGRKLCRGARRDDQRQDQLKWRDESTVTSLAPEQFLQMVSGLFLWIAISCSLLLLSLTINLFVAFFYFLPVCCVSYNLNCKLQKTLVHVYLAHSAVVLQQPLRSLRTAVLIATMLERDRKKIRAERYFWMMYSQ